MTFVILWLNVIRFRHFIVHFVCQENTGRSKDGLADSWSSRRPDGSPVAFAEFSPEAKDDAWRSEFRSRRLMKDLERMLEMPNGD